MTLEAVLYVLLAIVVVIALAYAAKYVVEGFFPAQLHVPALLLVGVVLLVVLVLLILRLMPAGTVPLR
jgi:hypothetical protein